MTTAGAPKSQCLKRCARCCVFVGAIGASYGVLDCGLAATRFALVQSIKTYLLSSESRRTVSLLQQDPAVPQAHQIGIALAYALMDWHRPALGVTSFYGLVSGVFGWFQQAEVAVNATAADACDAAIETCNERPMLASVGWGALVGAGTYGAINWMLPIHTYALMPLAKSIRIPFAGVLLTNMETNGNHELLCTLVGLGIASWLVLPLGRLCFPGTSWRDAAERTGRLGKTLLLATGATLEPTVR